MPSAALLAAQAALLERRANDGIRPAHAVKRPFVGKAGAAIDAGAVGDVGPGFALANAQATIREYQRRDGVTSTRPATAVSTHDIVQTAVSTLSPIATASIDPAPASAETITVHPSLLAAAMKDGRATAARVWLIARHLDKKGSGWVAIDDLRAYIAQNEIVGKRRLRQILKEGDGRFWVRTNKTSLTYRKPSRVMSAGNYGRFSGRSVKMPITAVMGGIHEFKAAILSAFHAGRPATSKDNPISRETIQTITGAAPSTQQTYDKTAGTAVKTNYAILATNDPQEASWGAGDGFFEFIDYKGQHGSKGQGYIVRQLPNSYQSPLSATSKNRTKRANANLPNNAVVDKCRKERVYCTDVKQEERAEKSYYRKGTPTGRYGFFYQRLKE